jgi:hypothetical protein
MDEKELIEGINVLIEKDVNKFTDKKGKLTYLSWANAWTAFLKVFPKATYTIEKNESRMPMFGNNKTGYMCYTTVTVEDLTHEMWLPVMDNRNQANLTPDAMAINKTVMRCLTKNLAMFGLGLYIYAGEDLPEDNTPVDVKAQVTEITSNIVRAYLTDPRFAESIELKDMKKALNEKSLLPNQYLVDELIKEYGALNA